MSNSCWIHWIDNLLFGSSVEIPTPPEFKELILRMEAENIPWSHIMLQGGLTLFPYQVHGDLNYLIDYLEKQWMDQDSFYEPQAFKTRAVSKFWDQLKILLVKRDEHKPPPLPTPSLRDDETLQKLLEPGYKGPYDYQSAPFWGEMARRFIQLHRPDTSVLPLSPVSSESMKKMIQLYDITCVARGQVLDPFTLHLIHHSEYVNAAHWQSSLNLKAFMRDQPTHSLTRSIQALLKHTLEEFLQGERPTALVHSCPRLDALLHNIRVIHEKVTQVPQQEMPPKLIDVFQRLLALSQRDELWEKNIPALESKDPGMGTSLFYLTEQLRMTERQRQLLWKQVIEASDPKRPQHICSDSMGASNTPCRLCEARKRPMFRH